MKHGERPANLPSGNASDPSALFDTAPFRRASELVMRWLDDDPTHRLVEHTERGTQAKLGPHEIALLDLFGAGRRIDEVLDILLPGEPEDPGRVEARAELLKAVARLINIHFLVHRPDAPAAGDSLSGRE